MPFEPQNPLEESLVRAADDPSHRPQFYRDLLDSDVFIVQHGPPPEEARKVVLQEGYDLRVEHIQVDGKDFFPIFTSLPRLQAFVTQEVGYIALNVLELFKIARGAEFLLNPGSEYGKELTKDEVKSLLDGTIWQPNESYVAQAETQVMIGQPSHYPQDLVDSLARLFSKQKPVKRAYLAQFLNPDQDQHPHTLIALEVAGDWDQIVAEAGMVVNSVEVPDPPVDFIQITGRGGIEDYFQEECEPFYRQKAFFGLFG